MVDFIQAMEDYEAGRMSAEAFAKIIVDLKINANLPLDVRLAVKREIVRRNRH